MFGFVAALLTVALSHAVDQAEFQNSTFELGSQPSECGLTYASALHAATTTWDTFKANLSDKVELLAFEGTLLHKRNHTSLRRTLEPLTLVEGTLVIGLKNGELELKSVDDSAKEINFIVRIKPLEIRGSLTASDKETHLLRCFLIDLIFCFQTNVGTIPMTTRYKIQKAGHVTPVQVANGDRTEVAFGQDLEALVAGAAVTTIFYEAKRAAEITNQIGEGLFTLQDPRPLQYDPHQIPDSWHWEGRHAGSTRFVRPGRP